MDGNLEYYKVFYHVAMEKSLTKAAEVLNISQPAVSQSMKMLESTLDVKLFRRTSRGVVLTPEGEILFDYVKNGYEQIAQGEQVLQKLMDLELGELHIGASDMTLRYYLLPYLEKYHELHPGVKMRITNAPTPETLRHMENGTFDLCLVSTPFALADGLTSIPVRQIEDVFVAGHAYTRLKNHMIDFRTIEDYPMIFLEKNTSTRGCIDELLAQNDIHLNPEFELANSDMIVQFALRNLGIGCVVKDFAKAEIESGKLFELRFRDIMIPRREICLVTNGKLPTSHAAQALLDLLLQDVDK